MIGLPHLPWVALEPCGDSNAGSCDGTEGYLDFGDSSTTLCPAASCTSEHFDDGAACCPAAQLCGESSVSLCSGSGSEYLNEGFLDYGDSMTQACPAESCTAEHFEDGAACCPAAEACADSSAGSCDGGTNLYWDLGSSATTYCPATECTSTDFDDGGACCPGCAVPSRSACYVGLTAFHSERLQRKQ